MKDGEIEEVKIETEEKQRHERKPKIPQEPDTPGKIMVSGIPKNEDYNERDLEKQFAPFGRITEVKIIRDKRSHVPRGFAFITYENPQDAGDAIKAMEGKEIGGEAPAHCEQAVIGYKKSLMMREERERGRGAPRGMRGRGGRGRGMMDPRGRGMRGGRGGFGAGMGRMYPDDDYYDDFYEPDMRYGGFPPRGRGGPPLRRPMGRGGPRGRGDPYAEGGPAQRGVSGRRVLLPNPPAPRGRGARGHPFGRPPRGPPPPREEYYGDEADGYGGGGDYYDGGDAYAEGYEESYADDGSYAAEGYYDQEVPPPTRGRGRGVPVARARGVRGVPARARGVVAHPPPRQQQLDEYGYPLEEVRVPQRGIRPQGQTSARPATIPRRPAPDSAAYAEEAYEEESPRIPAAASADLYGRARGRAPPAAAGAPGARAVRPSPTGNTQAPVRRSALFRGGDPYQAEDGGVYARAAPQGTAKTVSPASAAAYEDDPYADPYSRRAVAASRQVPVSRARSLQQPADDMYATDRPQPKASVAAGDPGTPRRAAIAAQRYSDNYQSASPAAAQARDVYDEARRAVARRMDPDYRMAREDPYRDQRVAPETDAYVSYPSSSRVAAESDPYSRKRPLEQYDDVDIERSAAALREYDEYRSAAASAQAKRERLDRSVYEAYSSRQEGAYRGL